MSVAALIVRVASAVVVAQPGYTDAFYYSIVASRLAHGEGLTADFIWNFLEAPNFAPLPIPSHQFWVPLATTRRFLRDNRELVTKICAIYRESIQLFKTQPKETIAEISRRLPALADKPQVTENCYKLFAELLEPSLKPSLNSISSILKEVALQDPRAKNLDPSSIVEVL